MLTPELLTTLRAASPGIVLWHEERDDEIRVLRTLDVDAICTNTPENFERAAALHQLPRNAS